MGIYANDQLVTKAGGGNDLRMMVDVIPVMVSDSNYFLSIVLKGFLPIRRIVKDPTISN